jgi:hypothetical protein
VPNGINAILPKIDRAKKHIEELKAKRSSKQPQTHFWRSQQRNSMVYKDFTSKSFKLKDLVEFSS